MNVLFVSHSNNVGGSEGSLRETINYLVSKGVNVYLSLPHNKQSDYLEGINIPESNVLYLKPMIWHKLKSKNFLKKIYNYIYINYKTKGGFLFTVSRLCHFMCKHNIDIVHSNTFLVLDGALAAKLCKKPHYQHVRELIGNEQAPFKFPFQKRPNLFRAIMNQLHNTIIFNSNTTKQTSKNLFPEDKSKIIPNPFSDSIYKNRSKNDEIKTIGLVSNVTSSQKNHQLFLDIAKIFRDKGHDYCFNIIGKLPDDDNLYYNNLKKFIIDNNLQNNVNFIGSISNIEDIYSNIDILIHTNRNESFGRIYIESMIFHVPLIALYGKAANEIIENNNNGILINDPNPLDFYKSIILLVNDSKFRKRITDNAYIYAERFKSSIINKKLLNLYYKPL